MNENTKRLAAAMKTIDAICDRVNTDTEDLKKTPNSAISAKRLAATLKTLDAARRNVITATKGLKKTPELRACLAAVLKTLDAARTEARTVTRLASALQKLDDARDKFIAVAEDLKKAPELGMKIKRPGSKAPHKRRAPRPV